MKPFHPYVQKWIEENWTVGQYTPSVGFMKIPNHSCVCKPNLDMITLTGPADDLESKSQSDLFSQAPQMYLLLEHLFYDTTLKVSPEINDRILATLKKARGECE